MAHTYRLDPQTLRAARALLDEVFGSDMDDHDWDHALGGMHALVWEGGELAGHGSVVHRRLLHGERTLRAGYVEAVAVRVDRRRRGYGEQIMDALEQVIRGAYDIGALGASEMGARLYRKRGWRQWQGRSWALTPAGRVRTPQEDDDIYVLETGVAIDLTGDLTCEWREGQIWCGCGGKETGRRAARLTHPRA